MKNGFASPTEECQDEPVTEYSPAESHEDVYTLDEIRKVAKMVIYDKRDAFSDNPEMREVYEIIDDCAHAVSAGVIKAVRWFGNMSEEA